MAFVTDMKNFLRDLAFLGLFAAAVAGIVMVVLVHQGRFSLPPDDDASDDASTRRAATVVAPSIPTERESVVTPAPQVERIAPPPAESARAATVAVADADAGAKFDPATRRWRM